MPNTGSLTLPELASKVGQTGSLRDPEGNIWTFTIKDEIRVPQSDLPQKILCLQLIEFTEYKKTELRLGYYNIGKKPRMLGKWVWGQYATLMPAKDFKKLVESAKAKGWI
jgi:hypothetical protein